MSGENGSPAKARADIQMRVVLDVERYGDAGALMDDIEEAMAGLLAGHRKARFDFVGFNTHPCKAMRMDRLADEPMIAGAQEDPMLELRAHDDPPY